VVLYSRNRYGNYPLASYAFHLGLRNDDRRVKNYTNLLFGNRARDNAFGGKGINAVPGRDGGGNGGNGGGGNGSDGAPGGNGTPGGVGGKGGTPGGGESGTAGKKGVAGAAGRNGENFDAGVDEFQVNMLVGSLNRVIDLGEVDYAKVTVPKKIQEPPDEEDPIPPKKNVVPVHVGHVYVVHIYGLVAPNQKQDFYVKLKVLGHRDNDAVRFEWEPLPRVERGK
jgi:hypothetical protein